VGAGCGAATGRGDRVRTKVTTSDAGKVEMWNDMMAPGRKKRGRFAAKPADRFVRVARASSEPDHRGRFQTGPSVSGRGVTGGFLRLGGGEAAILGIVPL